MRLRRRRSGWSALDAVEQDRVRRLATYNSEVARGLVHTPEYVERMAGLQRWYDAELKVRLR